jgi:septum formation protein
MVQPLFLASRSPRRKELLEWAHFQFEVYVPQEPELPAPRKLLKKSPTQLVKQIAEAKALAALRELTEKGKKQGIILAADTLVFLKDQVLGKPKNPADAKRLLRKLSGKWHVVCTGVSCIHFSQGKMRAKKSFVVKTKVKFFRLNKAQIDWYVKTKEPLDKAGAYGAQGHGMIFIEKFSGSYTNVVGLPLGETQAVLQKFAARKGKNS